MVNCRPRFLTRSREVSLQFVRRQPTAELRSEVVEHLPVRQGAEFIRS